MMRLLALRHARAAARDDYETDHERPLADEGRADARLLGPRLLELGLVPDLLLVSSALRARQTATEVAGAMGYDGEKVELGDLYDARTADDCLRVLVSRAGARRTVMLVGHNPAIEDLVRVLTGKKTEMKTCSLASVEANVDGWADVSPGSMELRALVTPRADKSRGEGK